MIQIGIFSYANIQIPKTDWKILYSVDHLIWAELCQVIGSIIWDAAIQNSTKRNIKLKSMSSLFSCPSNLGRIVAVFASTQSQQVGEWFQTKTQGFVFIILIFTWNGCSCQLFKTRMSGFVSNILYSPLQFTYLPLGAKQICDALIRIQQQIMIKNSHYCTRRTCENSS